MMTLQRQPSATSCGPTSVAMLVGAHVAEVLAWLPAVRVSAARRRRRDHKTNVGEAGRPLDAYGWQLGRRQRGPLPGPGPLLGRLEHRARRGWHWFVVAGGQVYDPCRPHPLKASALRRYDASRLSWYRVTPSTPGAPMPKASPSKPPVVRPVVVEVYEAPDGFRWRERRAGRTLRDNYTRRRDAHRAFDAFAAAIKAGHVTVVDLD